MKQKLSFGRRILFYVLSAFVFAVSLMPLMLCGKAELAGGTYFHGSTIYFLLAFPQLMAAVFLIFSFKERAIANIYVFYIVGIFTSLFCLLHTEDFNIASGICNNITSIIVISIMYSFLRNYERISGELKVQSSTDYLTGANNQRRLEEDLQEDVSHAGKPFALMLIDLDNFKHIIDVRGYQCGNEVLKSLVRIWESAMGHQDSLYRINGDEFAIIFRDYRDVTDLDNRIEKISHSLQFPVETGNFKNYLSACAGLVEFPSQSGKAEELRRFADAALAKAKKLLRGKGKFNLCYFNSTIFLTLQRELYVSDVLQTAVERGLCSVYFQPQYDARTKRLKGFESLLRLHDADGKSIAPEEFVRVAEKRGQINDIGSWVMRSAIDAFKKALDLASPQHKDVTVSINVSSIQFLEDHFIDLSLDIIRRSGLAVKNIIFELTESVFINSADKAIRLIDELHEMGIAVSMDDFGTGYSSLSYLHRFNFDEIKIDKSFVDTIGKSQKNDDFIPLVIDTGHKMHAHIVAEGVENEMQYQKLLADGCDIIQGYYFSKPVDSLEMMDMMGR